MQSVLGLEGVTGIIRANFPYFPIKAYVVTFHYGFNERATYVFIEK